MEIWDAYLEDGTLAGKDLIRGEAIPQGLYHLVCDILVRHKDGDYLLMLRDYNKDIHPGEWESTAGGSALKGENAEECAKRELREETGLAADLMTEIYYEVYHERQVLFHCYVCEVDCDKSSVTLQEGETIDYKWISEEEFIDFVNSDQIMKGLKRRYSGWFRQMGYLR